MKDCNDIHLQQLHELLDGECPHQNRDVDSQEHVPLDRSDTMCCQERWFRLNIVQLLLSNKKMIIFNKFILYKWQML